MNALVSIFLSFNKDGQLQRMGRESQTESLSCRYTDDFYIMKSNIDKRFHQDGNVAFFLEQYHSSAVTIVSSNDIPLVTSCLSYLRGKELQKVIIT